VTGWLARAAAAAQRAGERPDLWLFGALAWLPVVGWLPLIVAVARPVSIADLAFLGAELYGSGSYPWNVLLLSLAGAVGVITACLLAAAGQTGVLRGLADGADERSDARPWSLDLATAFGWSVMASLPLALALAVTGLGFVAIAPDEFTAPASSGPLALRLVLRLAPFLLLTGAALLVSLGIGAAGIRRMLGGPNESIGSALRGALRFLLRHPARLLGSALAVAAVNGAVLAGELALLRVLYAPIGGDLDAGGLLMPGTIGLLLAFVAIWLTLLLAGGALHTWSSAWWNAELSRDG
jgi:hypothetical protein